MKDYVIWLGEKLSKIYPLLTWERIMDKITSDTFDPKVYGLSVQKYLQERKEGIW